MDAIRITIPGDPVPWKAHAGYGRKSFNPRYKEKHAFQWYIKNQYSHEALKCPICLVASFFMPIPKSTSRKKREAMLAYKEYHVKKPDVSNLTKFLEDCLKKIVFEDDSQVYEIIARKVYAEEPRTEVIIYPIME